MAFFVESASRKRDSVEEREDQIRELRNHFYARNGRYPTEREVEEIVERETGGQSFEPDLRPTWMKLEQDGDRPPPFDYFR